MKLFRILVLLILSALAAVAGENEVILSGVVRDEQQVPLRGIRMQATAAGQAGVEGRTGEDGSFGLAVPEGTGPWTVQIDERELIEYGYFCEPGFVWNPGAPIEIGVLETVPLRPALSFERTASGVNCLRLSFDWFSGLQPVTLRQWRIEHSPDLENWREVVTVALACPPMEIFDETRAEALQGYYRAVPVDPVTVVNLNPGDFGFIADPAMNPEWNGPRLLVFDPAEPLPVTPVIAPQIIIRKDP